MTQDKKTPPAELSRGDSPFSDVSGFGASYQRTDDHWVIYTMPGAKRIGVIDGYNKAQLDWIVEALRAAHAQVSVGASLQQENDHLATELDFLRQTGAYARGHSDGWASGKRDLIEAIKAIADDFIPDRDADAPLALQEMRDSLLACISNSEVPTSPAPQPRAETPHTEAGRSIAYSERTEG